MKWNETKHIGINIRKVAGHHHHHHHIILHTVPSSYRDVIISISGSAVTSNSSVSFQGCGYGFIQRLEGMKINMFTAIKCVYQYYHNLTICGRTHTLYRLQSLAVRERACKTFLIIQYLLLWRRLLKIMPSRGCWCWWRTATSFIFRNKKHHNIHVF